MSDDNNILDTSEQEWLSANLEDSATTLQNFRTAFRLYVMHYTTCCEYAEQIADGELLDEYAVSYALEQLACSFKISRLLKSRLLRKDVKDSSTALIDLNNLELNKIVAVRESVLVLPYEQAEELADKLLSSFAKTRSLKDFEAGAYIRYLLEIKN